MAKGYTEVIVTSDNWVVPSGVPQTVQDYYSAVYEPGNPTLWFDPSIDEVVTISPDGKEITSILEMTRTIGFDFRPPTVSQGTNYSLVSGVFKKRAINAAYGGYTAPDVNPATNYKIALTASDDSALTYAAMVAVDTSQPQGLLYLASDTGSKLTFGIAARSPKKSGLALVYDNGQYYLATSSRYQVDAWQSMDGPGKRFSTNKAMFSLLEIGRAHV